MPRASQATAPEPTAQGGLCRRCDGVKSIGRSAQIERGPPAQDGIDFWPEAGAIAVQYQAGPDLQRCPTALDALHQNPVRRRAAAGEDGKDQ